MLQIPTPLRPAVPVPIPDPGGPPLTPAFLPVPPFPPPPLLPLHWMHRPPPQACPLQHAAAAVTTTTTTTSVPVLDASSDAESALWLSLPPPIAQAQEAQKTAPQRSSRRGPRQARTRVSDRARDEMLKFYRGESRYPNGQQKMALSLRTGLPVKVVANWFQNKRSLECRRRKEEERQRQEEVNL